MTKTEFIKRSNGQQFTRTVSGMATIEDIPQMREELQKLADANGLELHEDAKTWTISNRVWFKPRMQKREIVRVFFRSKDYEVYTNAREGVRERIGGGTIPPASEFTRTSFVIQMQPKGFIEYTQLTEGMEN